MGLAAGCGALSGAARYLGLSQLGTLVLFTWTWRAWVSYPGRSSDHEEKQMKGRSNRLVSADEMADLLGVSVDTLYREWRDPWGLTGYRIGRALKFRIDPGMASGSLN
jgi:hypothetical protein